MDIQPTNQPMTDDQELAKVLAGMNSDAPATSSTDAPAFSQPAAASDIGQAMADASAPAADAPAADMPADFAMPEMPAMPAEQAPAAESSAPAPEMPEAPAADAPAPAGDSELDAIKQQAIGELRPLVDKLDVPADEKFDTYLLLLRSTDDKALIAPAHEAAKAIEDESRRAQALLDIIKEIDFLSSQN